MIFLNIEGGAAVDRILSRDQATLALEGLRVHVDFARADFQRSAFDAAARNAEGAGFSAGEQIAAQEDDRAEDHQRINGANAPTLKSASRRKLLQQQYDPQRDQRQ